MFTTRPELNGTFGMVASTHWLASQCGMAVLESGGNAFDAAVATGMVLHVVEPHLNGPAGETPIIAHEAASGRTFVVNGQGFSPAAATADHFEGLEVELIPGTGLLPSVVPGSFGAWMHLLERYGTRSIGEVMQYAIGYARHGYPLISRAVDTISTVADLFRDHWTTSAEIYLRNGNLPERGGIFKNPALADTFERIVAEATAAGPMRETQIEAARRAFYEGFVAEAIVDYIDTEVMDSSGTPHAGLLSADDLAAWRATEEEPASVAFGEFTVHKTGPWGQGPVFLQQLALLDGMDLDDTTAGSAELIHTVVEVAKLAFADREAWYGDPAHVDVPMADLLSSAYAAERRTLIGREASGDLRPGAPGGRTPRLPALFDDPEFGLIAETATGVGEPTVSTNGETKGDTCHLDIVDRYGNMVTATPSGGWLQSSPAVPGLGFALSTRAQMFWIEQGLPNSVAPRKRPRTTLSPGMVTRDGRPYLAFGTPGGDQQDQWTMPFLINHLHYGMNLQEAIDAPSWHTAHFPSSFYPRARDPRALLIESRFDEAIVEDLRQRGHRIQLQPPWSLGRVSAAGIGEDGLLRSAANARGMQGYAVGR